MIQNDIDRIEYQYILDGQQRSTALYTSLFGGKIKGRGDFNPTLFIDLSVVDSDDPDETNFNRRFLFWSEIDDRGGIYKTNTPRKQRFDQGLIVKLQDVRVNFGEIERRLVTSGAADYDHPYRNQLRRIKEALDNYRIPFIELKGIQVAEVCQIFERINQAGEPLDIFDIVVAKTYRAEDKAKNIKAFYLRDIFDNFRKEIPGSSFARVDDVTLLQMLATLVAAYNEEAHVSNITDRYLNKLRAEHIEGIWDDAKIAIKGVYKFLDQVLKIKGPALVPYRYFYLTLLSYLFRNNHPDWEFLEKYFWFYSFHSDDLLSNTTDLWKHTEFLKNQWKEGNYTFGRFLINKSNLRDSIYSSKGRLSRAILALYSNQMPQDWAKPHNVVVNDIYYHLTDKPNLHHIFPLDYIDKHPGENKLTSDSLMNIAYLSQITNLNISNENPLIYMRQFDSPELPMVLNTHLIKPTILEWSRLDKMPDDALDRFIEDRIENIVDLLKEKLSGIQFDVIDTREGAQSSLPNNGNLGASGSIVSTRNPKWDWPAPNSCTTYNVSPTGIRTSGAGGR